MEKGKNIRNKILFIRLNHEEHTQMHRLFKNSASRRLSDFVRPIILAKPVNAKYRNASADDFLTAMLAMKKELNGIENNSQV